MISEKAIYSLHKNYSHGKYKEDILGLIWTHSQIVKEISLMIANNLEKNYGIKVNRHILKIGALVHDIGVYVCFDDDFKKIKRYVTHGREGYKILKNENIEEKVARFALTHVGVGLTKEKIIREQIPIEPNNYIPINLEEEIVCYADGFHSKGKPHFVNLEDMRKDSAEHGEEDKYALERYIKKFGEPDLKDMEIKYAQWHEEINLKLNKIHENTKD